GQVLREDVGAGAERDDEQDGEDECRRHERPAGRGRQTENLFHCKALFNILALSLKPLPDRGFHPIQRGGDSSRRTSRATSSGRFLSRSSSAFHRRILTASRR